MSQNKFGPWPWIQTNVDRYPSGIASSGNVLKNSAIRCWFELEKNGWEGSKSYSVTVTPRDILDFSQCPELERERLMWFSEVYHDVLPIPENHFSVVVLNRDGAVLARDLVPYDKKAMWGDDQVYIDMKRSVDAVKQKQFNGI